MITPPGKEKTQMLKRVRIALLTAIVGALLGGSSVRADNLPWSYNWTPSTLTVVDPANPTTKLHLTNEPLDAGGNPLSHVDVTGNSDIVATQISVSSDAPAGFPDEFKNSPELTLKLKITDTTSSQAFTFQFTGNFNTQNPADPSTASMANSNVKFTPTGTQQFTQQIGNSEYTVKFVSYTPPPPMGAANQGSIAYHVSVRSLDITKTPTGQTPEPASLLMAGIGAAGLGLGAWRKRRRAALDLA
jgi:hypothetical protein